MPRYDYKCKECECEVEHEHSYKLNPEFLCPDCESSVMEKTFKTMSFNVRNNIQSQLMKDAHFKESEMRQDLKENHMVEKIAPVACSGIEQVYKEVKASGSATKDQMQKTIEQNEAKEAIKRKEWQIGANRRVEKRTIEAREKRAEEAAAKRKITITTK